MSNQNLLQNLLIPAKKTLLTSSLVILAGSFLLSGLISTEAAWPNAAQNTNCNTATPTVPCQSLSRKFDASGNPLPGTDLNSWNGSDRSLNFDSPFTFGTTTPPQSNIQATPKLRNDGLSFCAINMRYRSGTVVDDTAGGAECKNVIKGTSGDSAAAGAGGYLTYGPYIQNLADDSWYEVTARIKVGNNTTATGKPVFRLDGNFKPDFVSPGISIGSQSYSSDLITLNSYTDYKFKFYKTSNYKIGEFRVYTFNTADISIDKVAIQPSTAPIVPKIYEGETMSFWNNTTITNQNINDAQAANTQTRKATGKGHVNFGPSTTDQIGGKWYKATYRLKVDSTTDAAKKAIILEANNSGTGAYGVIGRKEVRVSEISTTGYTDFSLTFYRPDNIGLMEYRVFNNDSLATYLDRVSVEEVIKPTQIKNTYEAEFARFRGTIAQDTNTYSVAQNTATWSVFGQYVKDLPTIQSGFGTYTAKYCVKNQGARTGTIGRYGIYKGAQIIGSGNIAASSLTTQGECDSGYFEFTTPSFIISTVAGDNLEFRYANAITGNETRVDKVIVQSN